MTYENVCILTEGGGAKGLGHVYRAITIAQQLPGARIEMLSDVGEHRQAWELIGAAGVQMTFPGDYDVVIRDVCGKRERLDCRLFVEVVDDPSEADDTADMVFAHLGAASHQPNRYYGLRYACLRQEFSEFSSWEEMCSERNAITVCLGGVDPTHSTPAIVDALRREQTKRRVLPIYGPGARISPGHDQPPVWEALSRSVLAVVSPGTTLLECAATGTPALVVSHNDREHERAQSLNGSWYRYLGRAPDTDLAKLCEAVEDLARDPVARHRMSMAGRMAVDGCGAWRVGGILRRAIARLPARPRQLLEQREYHG